SPRPLPLRGGLCLTRRRSTDPRFLRADRPPSSQPQRRSPTQPGSPHDRPPPPRPPRRDTRLRRTQDRGRQNATRDQALPQATPRQTPLSTTRGGRRDRLTNHRSILPADLRIYSSAEEDITRALQARLRTG